MPSLSAQGARIREFPGEQATAHREGESNRTVHYWTGHYDWHSAGSPPLKVNIVCRSLPGLVSDRAGPFATLAQRSPSTGVCRGWPSVVFRAVNLNWSAGHFTCFLERDSPGN